MQAAFVASVMRAACLAAVFAAAAAAGGCRWGLVGVTNVTAEPLRGASSEGLAALPDGAFAFNGDSSFAIADPVTLVVKTFRERVTPPERFAAKGYRHTGDVDYAAALRALVAPISGWPNASVPPAFVAVDVATLDTVPEKLLCVARSGGQVFAPWVAVAKFDGDHPADGHGSDFQFYSSDYDIAAHLHEYAPPSSPGEECRHVRALPLSMALVGVQGGVAWNSTTLLLACDDECVYSVDTRTGAVETALCLWALGAAALHELEGLAFADLRRDGLGRLHLSTGDFARPRDAPRPIFHLDCV